MLNNFKPIDYFAYYDKLCIFAKEYAYPTCIMKRFFLLFLTSVLFLGSAVASPRIKWNQTYQDYFNRYKDLAIREMLRYGIPASITLAQGVLESGAGLSRLATLGNNHFGIKCHGWTGRTISHDDDLNGECFRAYDTPLESYEDHSLFLTGRQRYSSLFQLSCKDYRGWAHGLKQAGYATNPSYAYKLIEIIELYQLYQYDNATSYAFNDEPKQKETRPKATTTERRKGFDVNSVIHQLRPYNQNFYLVARSGDTFKSLAKEIGMSAHKLARINERGTRDIICDGEIIWTCKKQKRAPREFKKRPHIVRSSESLYDIAQKYGIRLKSLVKKNRRLAEQGVKVGDEVRIY